MTAFTFPISFIDFITDITSLIANRIGKRRANKSFERGSDNTSRKEKNCKCEDIFDEDYLGYSLE